MEEDALQCACSALRGMVGSMRRTVRGGARASNRSGRGLRTPKSSRVRSAGPWPKVATSATSPPNSPPGGAWRAARCRWCSGSRTRSRGERRDDGRRGRFRATIFFGSMLNSPRTRLCGTGNQRINAESKRDKDRQPRFCSLSGNRAGAASFVLQRPAGRDPARRRYWRRRIWRICHVGRRGDRNGGHTRRRGRKRNGGSD